MDTAALTTNQKNEVAEFASAFLSKKEILKITQLNDCPEIDNIIEVERLKRKAIINNAIFLLAENNSADAIKQALKIIDSANQARI